MAVRTTLNNARTGKNGVFQAKHLDGPDGKASKMDGLLYTVHGGPDDGMSFEEAEADFYETHFMAGLAAQNKRHEKGGHKNRIKTMDEYRTARNTCPECTLYYLGDKAEHMKPRVLQHIVTDFLEWRDQEYPQVVILDLALHVEDGAPHIHERHVWIGHDKDGNEIVNQEAALREMGVLPPDPSRPVGRYNNAKMTYTEKCREKMVEIAREHGIEIIEEPREAGQKGLSQARYKTQDEQRKRDAALKEATELVEDVLVEQGKKSALQQEQERLAHKIGNMTEYLAWEAEKETQAALWRELAQEAQEGVQGPQDAQEDAGEVQEAGTARNAQKRPQDVAEAPVRAASMERMIQDVRRSFREEMERAVQNGLERE